VRRSPPILKDGIKSSTMRVPLGIIAVTTGEIKKFLIP
jgi:hypothetical protein